MESKELGEYLIYIGACMCTLGTGFLLRIIITQAIKQANKD